MSIHHLKCDPGPFRDVQLGLKRFEVRRNDRDYQVGDVLALHEHHPHTGYLGQGLSARVEYIFAGGYGLKEGYVILGFDEAQEGCVHQCTMRASDGSGMLCEFCGHLGGGK